MAFNVDVNNTYSTEKLKEMMSSSSSVVEALSEGLDYTFSFDLYGSATGERMFAGINKTGIGELQQKLNAYADSLQEIISGYNENADITGGLAANSKTQIAASNFIADVKVLLQAYIDTLRAYAKQAQDAYDNYSEAEGKIGSAVGTDVKAIKDAASKVEID